MTDLEMRALDTLRKGIRWKLDGEPCWCPCKRTVAWRDGTKQHTTFCRAASDTYHLLLDEAVANPFPDEKRASA